MSRRRITGTGPALTEAERLRRAELDRRDSIRAAFDRDGGAR